jgi:hypothetical protein
LKAAASLMRQWYRPMLIIWAVDAPSLQGAAAASAGNGFACHINCVLLPKRVLQPSPSDQVQLKKDEFASCEAPSDLPPLILEGTGAVINVCTCLYCTNTQKQGYLDPIVTPPHVSDRSEIQMDAIKKLKKHSSLFTPEVKHVLMPKQYAKVDGNVSFYKYAVHGYCSAYENANDFYFSASTGTYGVSWDQFIQNSYGIGAFRIGCWWMT